MFLQQKERHPLLDPSYPRRTILLQGTISLVVGAILGMYLLGALLLPTQLLYLAVLLIIAPFIVMIVGNMRRLLLAIILIEIPFQLDIYLFYNEQIAASGALPGLNISVTTLALAVLYALWLAKLLSGMHRAPHDLWQKSRPLLVYISFVLLSVVVAQKVELALYEVALLLQSLLLFLYIVGTVRSREDVVLIMSLLLVGLILESFIMIGLRVVGHDFYIGNIAARIESNGRVGGTFGSPILAASYLGLLIAPALSILLTRLTWPYKWLGTLGLALGGLALIFTLSRGGWITLMLSTGIFCFFAWWRGWLSITVILAVLAVLVGLGIVYQEAIITRIFGDDGGSAAARPILMDLAWRMIREHPWLGVGSNNFSVKVSQYTTPEFNRAWLYTVHNKYLLVWAETGIGALLAFFWFLGTTLARGWRCWQLKDRLFSPLGLAMSTAIVGHMVHMTVDVFHSRSQVQMLWLVAALITVMESIGASGSSEASDASSASGVKT